MLTFGLPNDYLHRQGTGTLEFSECADADKDHKCEYCGEEITKCVDADKDHSCDICGKVLSECADADKDHKCEYCGKELSVCADADKDHKCDVCGKELSVCADADKDHKCDVCGKELSECADANNNHKCDVCDKDMNHNYSSEWKSDATGHWHECSCGSKIEVTAHTPGAAATATTDQVCTVCGFVIAAKTGTEAQIPSGNITLDIIIDNGKIYVGEISRSEIEAIINGAEGNFEIVIDVAGLEGNHANVSLPVETLKQIIAAAVTSGRDGSIVLKLDNATVRFDVRALSAIATAIDADASHVDITLTPVDTNAFSEAQKNVLNGMNVFGGITASVICNQGVTVSDFKGGKVNVTVPFVLPEGIVGEQLRVWHIAVDGLTEKMTTSYANGEVSFETGHFSDFVISLDNEVEEPARKPVPVIVWIASGFVFGAMVVAVVIFFMEKKKKFS